MTLEQTKTHPVHFGTLWGNCSVGFAFPSNYMRWLRLKPQGSASESHTQGQAEGARLVTQNSLKGQKKPHKLG